MYTTTVDVLMAKLQVLAPNVVFSVEREHDTDCRWEKDFNEQGLDQDDFECWQHDVSAKAILGGKEIEGNAYLGGGWELFGEKPDKEIGGYLTQMLQEAAEELCYLVPDGSLNKQLVAVIEYLSQVLSDEYDAQM